MTLKEIREGGCVLHPRTEPMTVEEELEHWKRRFYSLHDSYIRAMAEIKRLKEEK
jgi:hypothetical protein